MVTELPQKLAVEPEVPPIPNLEREFSVVALEQFVI
jgi:hypothetical protein